MWVVHLWGRSSHEDGVNWRQYEVLPVIRHRLFRPDSPVYVGDGEGPTPWDLWGVCRD